MDSPTEFTSDTSQTTFDHAYTPDTLAKLNLALSLALQEESVNDRSIEKIIDQRADLVESLLNNLDEQQKRCFAAQEIKTNDAILKAVSEKRTLIKAELSKVSKASKGIKKYHQV